jgi:hypothetical protein
MLRPHWIGQRRTIMSDDFTTPEEPAQSAISQVADGIQSASQGISDAIERGQQPGMPLNTLARRVREAPLAALAIAFMIGVLVGRRRWITEIARGSSESTRGGLESINRTFDLRRAPLVLATRRGDASFVQAGGGIPIEYPVTFGRDSLLTYVSPSRGCNATRYADLNLVAWFEGQKAAATAASNVDCSVW